MIYRSLITILTIILIGCSSDKSGTTVMQDSVTAAPGDSDTTDSPTPGLSADEGNGTGSNNVTNTIPIQTPELSMPKYIDMPAPVPVAPTKVRVGMSVADALRVPGATQSVSAIMTGGKITGTVVIQWKGKSYYTNVDFAQEGCFANGTRYTTPQDVEAFIELACSEQLCPADFTEQAIVTELIK